MAIDRPNSPSNPNPPPQSNKLRWSDLQEDDNGEYLNSLLPLDEVIGPDENGIKKVITYKRNDEGKVVKVTTTTRVRKLKLSKGAVERRSWAKFGDAVHDDVRNGRLTIVSTDEILLESPKAHGSNAEATKTMAQLGKGDGVLMFCRTCKKGDHWTTRCPYKDLPPGSIYTPSSADATAASSVSTNGTYVPPGMRGGAEGSSGSDMRRRKDDYVLRVSNLPKDTRESDLHDLFIPFGPLTRVYVVIDHRNGVCRGVGFVNFFQKEDAAKAINTLNGYGYGNLILNVEWATPKSN